MIVALTLAPASAHASVHADPLKGAVIAEQILATWTCQDNLQVPRTPSPANRSPWRLKHHSDGYKSWLLNVWLLRYKACRTALHAHDVMIRTLQRGLTGTPMAGTGAELEAAGRRYHVHPAFIAAIAGTESTFGAAACASNQYNAFGLSSCGSGWSVPNFQSWGEVYEFMGRFLSSRWPSAATTYDYHGYAANSVSWGAKCAYWMQARFGLGNGVRYA